MRVAVHYLWKVPLCVLAYMVGMVAGGVLLPSLGMKLPDMPAQADPQLVMLYTLIATAAVAAATGPVACAIRGRYAVRWLALFLFAAVCLSINTGIEASIFTKVAGLPVAVFGILPALLLAAAAALVFRPEAKGAGVSWGLGPFLASRSAGQWAWRILAAILAFPIIYFAFGMPVGVLIGDYYRQEQFGLILPPLGTVIVVQLVRSVLFLAATFPIVALWSGSRRRLVLALGAALFVFVGLFGMIQAHWLPAHIRAVHTVEFLADSMVYALALAGLLFVPAQAEKRCPTSGSLG
jgi:MFS family permease